MTNKVVNKMSVRELTLGAMMVAVTAVSAQIMLPLPLTPIQFSLQVFAVLLTAALLPLRPAVLSMVAYLLLGLFGVPVFGGFKGGPGVLFGVTGGFLIAFPLMTLWVAWLLEKQKRDGVLPLFLTMASSLVGCYLVGCLWFSMVSGAKLSAAAAAAVWPFVLPDLLKCALAALCAVALRRVGKLTRQTPR
ncbi:MAG: biotin transporter BioY [Angelakisella sp.]